MQCAARVFQCNTNICRLHRIVEFIGETAVYKNLSGNILHTLQCVYKNLSDKAKTFARGNILKGGKYSEVGENILKWGKIFSISAQWHTQTHMDRQQKHFCLEYKWIKTQTKKSIKSSNQRLISVIKG